MHSRRCRRAMNGDDFRLSPSESARWHAIVSREWHPESQTQPMPDCGPRDVSDLTSPVIEMPRTLTIFRPQRPMVSPLAVGALAACTFAWLVVQRLIPTYEVATLTGLGRQERVIAVRELLVFSAVAAGAVLVVVASLSTWVIVYARYRLRRSAFDKAMSGATPAMRTVRPPNPATAVTWVLLLLTTSASAYWWITSRLDRALSGDAETVAWVNSAALAGIGWLAIIVLCIVGLAAWSAREARHRLRRAASDRASR